MIWALVAISGAIIGSFLATIVVRWPEGRSVMKGRSACDQCGTQLRARDLIPLFSAAFSRNRCRMCKAPVDPAHPSIEVACAVIGAVAFLLPLSPMAGIALAVFGWILVPLAWLDWRHFWLPDRLNIALAVAGLLLGGFLSEASLMDRLIGGLAGFCSLWAIASLYARVRGRQGLGGGDAKMLGGIGLWVGWAPLPLIILAAAIIGIAIAFIRSSQPRATQRLPFGTALAIAALGVAASGFRLPF